MNIEDFLAQLAGAAVYTNYIFAECFGYDTKQSDGDASVMLEFWGMWSTSLLPSLPVPLWPGVLVLDKVTSMGQIELNCVLTLNCLK